MLWAVLGGGPPAVLSWAEIDVSASATVLVHISVTDSAVVCYAMVADKLGKVAADG